MCRTAALLLAAALIGCQRIDANRSNPVPEEPATKNEISSAPASTRSPTTPSSAATTPTQAEPATSTAPDNTAVNQRNTKPGAKRRSIKMKTSRT